MATETKVKAKKYSFETQTTDLLNLMINSIYSHKEIFLRELISNSSDALDKIRFQMVTEKKLQSGSDLKISIEIDSTKRILTISDNGIGMTEEELKNNIGTIARSGTKEFLKKIQKKKDEKNMYSMIGQFGVGFYSAFMVSNKVKITTKSALGDKAFLWESKGDGNYFISEAQKDSTGTKIELYLKLAEDTDNQDFTQEWVIEDIIKKYSDFINYPIELRKEKEEVPKDKDGKEIPDAKKEKVIEYVVVNSMKPIWLKSKSQVSQEEHNEFYKHISKDWTEPLDNILIKAEGSFEYSALIYIPSKAPMDLYYPTYKSGLQLFTKRVMIVQHCEDLTPKYLRFLKGVVESSDLPLNISREMLQNNRYILQIRKKITKKALDHFKNLLENKREKYIGFWKEFGNAIKEGRTSDFENTEKLDELFLFHSSKSNNDYTTLKEYCSRMKPEQENIYYLAGENLSLLKNSPFLEVFHEKDIEVLFLVDPIDEFVMQHLTEYQGKKLQSANKESFNSEKDKIKTPDQNSKKTQEEYKSILECLQKHLEQHVKEVRISDRLVHSLSCLVSGDNDMSPHIEKILKNISAETNMPQTKRVLEINPKHLAVKNIKSIYSINPNDVILEHYAHILYGSALIAEGSEIPEATKFNESISAILNRLV